jgi:uncharacterized protein
MNTGEKNLTQLLKTLQPTLHSGSYVFCTTKDTIPFALSKIILLFKEKEGYTIIVEKNVADSLQIEYNFVAAWITLTVHSALEAVGLTAAFSKALADVNISCNVVAGYYHDHIFVPQQDAEKAMAVLESLAHQ